MSTPQDTNPPSVETIQTIENYILSCHKIPMTSSVLINEDHLFSLLDKLRDTLPTELHEATEIVSHKSKILSEAQVKAQKILKASEQEVEERLGKSNLGQKAKQLVQQAKKDAKAQQVEADKYSEQVLADLEVKVQKALKVVKTGRENLSQNIAVKPQTSIKPQTVAQN